MSRAGPEHYITFTPLFIPVVLFLAKAGDTSFSVLTGRLQVCSRAASFIPERKLGYMRGKLRQATIPTQPLDTSLHVSVFTAWAAGTPIINIYLHLLLFA
ncbi:hypothetical protein E2C01_096668 [Portunus trituberculatus]|uniref:Uncharacterized protein n=1 Tax=Portunus trituberculatus TaxID=210409 RepID=A0A5B7JT54_PORTR|nr:hypothetical protein [Portunus trituberculatus]